MPDPLHHGRRRRFNWILLVPVAACLAFWGGIVYIFS